MHRPNNKHTDQDNYQTQVIEWLVISQSESIDTSDVTECIQSKRKRSKEKDNGDESSKWLTMYFCESYVKCLELSLKRLITLLTQFIIIPKLRGGNYNKWARAIIESTSLNY